MIYKNNILNGLRIKHIYFSEYEELVTTLTNLQCYKNKNRLRTIEPENWLKNKNAEPHLKKLCSYKKNGVYIIC